MMHDSSRRDFLKAGLIVPAAGIVTARQEASVQAPSVQTPPAVSYRQLGKTGQKVATVGFGTGFNPKPEVLQRAFDLGVNYYDTARSYGNGTSEKILGAAFRGKRDKIIITTKGGGRKKEDLFKEIEESLKALQTDYVDNYLLHGQDDPGNLTDEIIEGMVEIKKQGKARHIGLSTHDPNNVVDRVINAKKFDLVLLTYSYPIGGAFREAAIQKLNKSGIGVVVMKAVVAISGIRMMELFAQGKGLNDMPKEMFVPRAKGEACLSAIKWVLNNPAISTVIVDHNNIANLEMNVRAMSEKYTAKDERLLYALNEQIRPHYCRMCYECKGQCPKGMPVADTLRFLAYNDFAGNYYPARQNFADLPEQVRNIRCNHCSTCSVKCPSGVLVQERLIRAQELLA
jgi:hypothetical protein